MPEMRENNVQGRFLPSSAISEKSKYKEEISFMLQHVKQFFATPGLGASNLITGIADSNMDFVPDLYIAVQVYTSLLGTVTFQKTDIISISMPLTKWNYQITQAEEIPDIIAAENMRKLK
jgi:glyoxylate carboligase